MKQILQSLLEKLRKIHLAGWLMVLPGVIFVFLGAAGAVRMIEDLRQQTDQTTIDIPRDQIESGYTAFEASTPGVSLGFAPYFMPENATPAANLPTIDAPADETLSGQVSTEIAQTPSAPTPNSTPGADDSQGIAPEWIYIPSLKVEAPIVPAKSEEVDAVTADGTTTKLLQWLAPDDYAVGWHMSSAPLGVPGNTVLNGHHNEFGKVFGTLAYLQEGDLIQVYGGGVWFNYVVTNKMVLAERDVPLEQRLKNAVWIMPSEDERLTLITCWPETTNTHRLIIVARPLRADEVVTPTPSPTP